MFLRIKIQHKDLLTFVYFVIYNCFIFSLFKHNSDFAFAQCSGPITMSLVLILILFSKIFYTLLKQSSVVTCLCSFLSLFFRVRFSLLGRSSISTTLFSTFISPMTIYIILTSSLTDWIFFFAAVNLYLKLVISLFLINGKISFS